MNEQKFKSEMRKAQNMAKLDQSRSRYWSGYQNGMRKQFQGEQYGTPQEHAYLMHGDAPADSMRQQYMQGYRDGYSMTAPKSPGRPALYAGDKSIQISFRLPESMSNQLGADKHTAARDIVMDFLKIGKWQED